MSNATKILLGVLSLILLLGMVGGGMVGCPKYNVWQQGLAGQAELKRAEQNRQIAIQEAQALKESAQFKADAEIIRARGVAQANKIIGDSLKDNSEYLRYLYIDMLRETGGDGRETIYIPTEAGMPILEAGRFNSQFTQPTE
jgi:regulator of protease activity HflC (stomatin/prohibitin superfamily)